MSPTQNSDRKDELEFKRLELEQQKLEIEWETYLDSLQISTSVL
jgi:hypothetical protein